MNAIVAKLLACTVATAIGTLVMINVAHADETKPTVATTDSELVCSPARPLDSDATQKVQICTVVYRAAKPNRPHLPRLNLTGVSHVIPEGK